MPKAFRSVLAVLAGYLAMAAVIIALTLLCVRLLHLQSGHPTGPYLVLSLALSFAAAVLGGWVAAKVAGYRPLEHGVALGALILVLGVLFLIHPAPGQPLWHQWLLTLGSPFLAVWGASLARLL